MNLEKFKIPCDSIFKNGFENCTWKPENVSTVKSWKLI